MAEVPGGGEVGRADSSEAWRAITRRRRANGASLLLDGVFVAMIGCMAGAYGLSGADHPVSAPVFVTSLALAGVLWWWLPWERGAGRAGRLCSASFAAVTLVIGMEADGHMVMPAIALVNLVMVLGVTPGIVDIVLALLVAAAVHRFENAPFAMTAYGLGLAVTFYTAVLAATALFRRRRQLIVELAARNVALERTRRRLEEANRRVRELAVADERGRFARDMHDAVGHHLVSATLTLREARRLREHDPEAAWAEVDAAAGLTRAALDETRRTVRGLRPDAVEHGLDGGALAALTERFSTDALVVRLTVRGGLDRLPPDAGLVVYRTVQEGMTNLVKHSDATRAHVRVTVHDDGGVCVEIVDNGAGPPPATADPVGAGDGVGLASLRERAAALGGHVRAGAQPGGFRLRVALPVSPCTAVC